MNKKKIVLVSLAAGVAAVALGAGGASAASLIGSAGIKDGAVRSIDIKDNSVKRMDLSKSINKALANVSKQGPAGADGQEGKQGPAGKDATADTYVAGGEFDITPGHNEQLRVACNPGDVVTGGGFSTNDHNAHFGVIYQNRPDWINVDSGAPDGWIVQGYGGDQNAHVNVWALCINKTA